VPNHKKVIVASGADFDSSPHAEKLIENSFEITVLHKYLFGSLKNNIKYKTMNWFLK